MRLRRKKKETRTRSTDERIASLQTTQLITIGLVVLVGGLLGWGFLEDREDDIDRETEQVERRDQDCRSDEREYNAHVRTLRQIYSLLDKIQDTAMRGEPFDKNVSESILLGLPILERNARKDRITVPAYCDRKGFGLREPGPKVPRRRTFDFLQRQILPPGVRRSLEQRLERAARPPAPGPLGRQSPGSSPPRGNGSAPDRPDARAPVPPPPPRRPGRPPQPGPTPSPGPPGPSGPPGPTPPSVPLPELQICTDIIRVNCRG